MDRNAEFNYMLAFVVESSFENELSRDQLRCLWTAYCFHNNLDADTYEYESPLSPEQQMHPSETALDHTVPDHWVYNDGTLGDLENTIAAWIRDCAFFQD